MCESPIPYGPTHAEWIPLDGIAQAFADFGAEATSPLTWQATGSAFLALSVEASAHLHDAFYRQHLGQRHESSYVCGLEKVRREVQEAMRQWDCTVYWLERLANSDDPLLPTEAVRRLIGVARQQQDRLLELDFQLLQEKQGVSSEHHPLSDPIPAGEPHTAERQEHA